MIIDNPTISGSALLSGSLTITGSLNVSGSISGLTSNAVSASYALSSSFALNGTSASYALVAATSSYADTFTVAGTLTAQKLVVQTITSSIVYSSGSNVFGNSISNTQSMTGSVGITGSLSVNGNITGSIIKVNELINVSASTTNVTTFGSIGYNGTIGNFWRTKAGTFADFAFIRESGAYVLRNAVGTDNLFAGGDFNIAGALSGTSATFSGNGAFGGSVALTGIGGGISINHATTSGIQMRVGGNIKGYCYTTNTKLILEAVTSVGIDMYVNSNGSPSFTIASTGAATFSSGIGIGGATATTGGIQFPATQVAIADANNLDDYEEGTWTPTATFSGGNGDLSYTVQAGSYVKVGRLVTCMGYLLFSETTASGNLTIGGLPFTAGYTPTSTLIRFGIGVDNLTGLSGMPTGEIGNGATSIGMSYTGTGTATSISNSNTGGNAVFRMNFSYTV
jgi:hypothetical protein